MALGGERTVGIDVVGGIASLVTAVLLDAGERVVHVPGLAVNRARQGTTGGEAKSDPRDARVIAEQVRTRRDLRPIEAFCSLQHPVSRAFYDRKRREGKRHHQALIALARRRVNVLWAMLRDRHPYQVRPAGQAA